VLKLDKLMVMISQTLCRYIMNCIQRHPRYYFANQTNSFFKATRILGEDFILKCIFATSKI